MLQAAAASYHEMILHNRKTKNVQGIEIINAVGH